MHFERLVSIDHPFYKAAMELYQQSFPFHEQREPDLQKKVLQERDYRFYLVFDKTIWAGLLLCWETREFIYVEHFCIAPDLRNKKYGQRALSVLEAYGKTVILEIDPPVDALSQMRKMFYERAGYRANPFFHLHPSYHQGYRGHELVVMSNPHRLTGEEYRRFDQYLKNTVMKQEHGS